jgi:serine acetyltransferase
MKDVPPDMVVAWIPAQVIREQRSWSRMGKDLHYIRLVTRAFQDK